MSYASNTLILGRIFNLLAPLHFYYVGNLPPNFISPCFNTISLFQHHSLGTIFEQLQCAQHYAKYLLGGISCNLHNSATKRILLLPYADTKRSQCQ